MKYYTKPFNYDNTSGLPSVTKEYLISIGVEETSVGYYDESENKRIRDMTFLLSIIR